MLTLSVTPKLLAFALSSASKGRIEETKGVVGYFEIYDRREVLRGKERITNAR